MSPRKSLSSCTTAEWTVRLSSTKSSFLISLLNFHRSHRQMNSKRPEKAMYSCRGPPPSKCCSSMPRHVLHFYLFGGGGIYARILEYAYATSISSMSCPCAFGLQDGGRKKNYSQKSRETRAKARPPEKRKIGRPPGCSRAEFVHTLDSLTTTATCLSIK
ncbi:hypothetical protein T492DRAFT_248632 [Pavlovales sp. CCMP2436]|nr:hypothetical protein T492DRAFT_248632 [Pavlovales sp. CCMP2436]